MFICRSHVFTFELHLVEPYCKGEKYPWSNKLTNILHFRLRQLCNSLLNLEFHIQISYRARQKSMQLAWSTVIRHSLILCCRTNWISHHRLNESPKCKHSLRRSWKVASRGQRNSMNGLSQRKRKNSDYKQSRKCHLMVLDGNTCNVLSIKWRGGIIWFPDTHFLRCKKFK